MNKPTRIKPLFRALAGLLFILSTFFGIPMAIFEIVTGIDVGHPYGFLVGSISMSIIMGYVFIKGKAPGRI